MGCDVFANNNEIACKASDNKVIADMPDVCLSPPSPPAGPVPVPYPDTSFSKDMQSGSKTVMIKDEEVMLKDQSFYKTSPLGDEAATNSFGANVVSHVITGKTFFMAWSMDVKFEDQNVDRHIDITTSNNASPATTTAPGPSLATMTPAQKAAAGHQREVKPPCKKHHWDCDTQACKDCWVKPCAANAEHVNNAYHEQQSGTQKEKRNKFFQAKDDDIAAGRDAVGAKFEKTCVVKTMNYGEEIERLSYMCHCKVCHMEQEIDIVTTTSMKECKHSSDGVDLGQMKQYASVNYQCFDDSKELVAVTRKGEQYDRLVNKVASEAWEGMNVRADDP